MTETLTPQRLNKELALHLGISRREADSLIEKGLVTVNNTVATLGARLTETDIVAVKGKLLPRNTAYTYVVLNKPAGFVSSRRKQGDDPTLYALLPKEYQTLKTVGRLDKDSSGLILLSNDGDFTYRMTHPSFHKAKTYEVRLSTPLEPLHQQMISDYGVQLEDGKSKLLLEKLDDAGHTWRITMHEGRNRQIRRTFASLGYTVTKLHRTHFGNYSLDGIHPGKFKAVDMR